MSRILLLRIPALLAAVLGSSCAPQGEHFNVTSPSSKVTAEARIHPKDRHGMPVYPFQDKRRLVRTTAYTCSEADHLKYGSKSAAGSTLMYQRRARSAAADWSYYPLGTTFRIKGMPALYVVDDYGSALTGTATIDLYKPNHQVMKQWGLRQVEVKVVKWGSMRRSVELLSKRTRHRHCRQMLNNILRIQPALRRYAQLDGLDKQPTLTELALADVPRGSLLGTRMGVW